MLTDWLFCWLVIRLDYMKDAAVLYRSIAGLTIYASLLILATFYFYYMTLFFFLYSLNLVFVLEPILTPVFPSTDCHCIQDYGIHVYRVCTCLFSHLLILWAFQQSQQLSVKIIRKIRYKLQYNTLKHLRGASIS